MQNDKYYYSKTETITVKEIVYSNLFGVSSPSSTSIFFNFEMGANDTQKNQNVQVILYNFICLGKIERCMLLEN